MKKHHRISIQTLLIPIIILFFCTTAFSPGVVTGVSSTAEASEVIPAGIAYLGTQVNDDGGVRWFDESSSPAATLRVVLALAAAGYEQGYLKSASGFSPIDYLKNTGVEWVNQQESDSPAFSVARAGQLLTAIAAANMDPQAFGVEETNLVYPVIASYNPNTGAYGTSTAENVTEQVWAMLGLASNGFTLPSDAVTWLTNAQTEDGSWDDGYGSNLDTTPLAILALLASGEVTTTSTTIHSAIDFLISNQQEEGGWQSEWDTTTNANTTAVVLQTISALGQLPMEATWQNHEGNNPYTALLVLQQDNGAIGGDYANAYSTADAIVALSGQTLFGLGYLIKADLSFDYIFSQQASDGGWGSVGQTLDIILALQAAGWDSTTVTVDEQSALDYLAGNMAEYIESGPDAIGKAILGVTATRLDPTDFAGLDLVAALNATFDETTGVFGAADNTWHQALAILGLYASKQAIPSAAVNTLKELQQDDGGWEYATGFGSWPDNTALALQALLAAGVSSDDTVIQNGLGYLQSSLTETGGWGDSSTTAYALMALNALGIPNSEWMKETGLTPLSELFSFQKSNGSFVYNWEYADDNLMSTASALLALFGEDLIISPLLSTDLAYAGLVIDPGEGEATTICVPLDNDSISGFDLLDASGADYSAPEGFVESIMDISNANGETNYWSYWRWIGNAWVFASGGAGDSIVQPGSIEAWHFTSWEIFPSLAPDVVPNLSAMCETTVLKDFTEQPYLNFNDLYSVNFDDAIETTPVVIEEATNAPDKTAESVEENLPEETQSPEETGEIEERSLLPFYLIGGAGLILVVIVLLTVSKKKK